MDITKDKKNSFLESYNHIVLLLNHIKGKLISGELDDKEKSTYLSLLESYNADLFEIMEYEKDIKQKIKDRSKKLYNANMTIMELEKQLGQKVSFNDIVYGFEAFMGEIKEWWKGEGFTAFKPFYMSSDKTVEVKLPLTLHREYQHLFRSNSEAENKKLKQKDEDKFKELNHKYDFSGKDVVDNDKNREKLLSLILDRFPDAMLKNYKTATDVKGNRYIRDISFILSFHNIKLPSFR